MSSRHAAPHSREPLTERKAPLVLAMIIGLAATAVLWDERGPIAGVVAALTYGGLALARARGRVVLVDFGRQHPVLDSSLLAPLTFLALAYITDLSLVVCALIGVAAWLVLLPVVLLRRSR